MKQNFRRLKKLKQEKIVIDTRSIDDLKTVADLYSYAKTHQYKPGMGISSGKSKRMAVTVYFKEEFINV